jgi:hypothetical protein
MEMQILKSVRGLALTERVWFNALWFQSTWFCCVLGRDSWLPLTLVMLGLHFALVAHPLVEARRLAPIALAGIVVDSALSAVGIFDFGPGVIIPPWLALLWVAFATTLNRSLAFLGRYGWIAAAVGGITVPFNYAVGAKLGAVAFGLSPMLTAAVLVAVWAMLLPNLYRLARQPIAEVPGS